MKNARVFPWFAAALLMIVCLFSASIVFSPAVTAELLGDVNDDGKTDSTDARLTLQYFVGSIEAEDLDLSVADVDGNDKVDSTDARLILQYFVGVIDRFPVEPDDGTTPSGTDTTETSSVTHTTMLKTDPTTATTSVGSLPSATTTSTTVITKPTTTTEPTTTTTAPVTTTRRPGITLPKVEF